MNTDYELLSACLAAVVWMVLLLLALTFLSAIARVLRRVPPEHRRIGPGQVWLNLIPVFNLVWATVTVERVAESLRNEFVARGLHGPEERYGRRAGLTMLTLLVVGALGLIGRGDLNVLMIVTYPLAFLHWVSYWVQMNRYFARLKPGAYTPPPTEEGW